jgi:uncharacterized protein YbjT (DUF2867 family)
VSTNAWRVAKVVNVTLTREESDMRVLVCGSTGCIGGAVTRALLARGHHVLGGGRSRGLHIDFMAPVSPQAWAQHLREWQVDAVVNCVGILREDQDRSFARVHAQGPSELFRGAALAGVRRVVQVSALGAQVDAHTRAPAYLKSKREADDVLMALPLHGTVLRPSLVYGPGSSSARLFATLAALPVVALPGGGTQRLQPIHVFEVAEIVARCLERADAAPGVFEIGGAEAVSYRQMLLTYAQAQGLATPLWLPLPMACMFVTAWAAEALPQQVFCRETLRMLAAGCVPQVNAAASLLGRAPTGLAQGLAISRPQAALNLHANISPPLAWLLRGSLAFMWLWTAAISAAWPQESGVMALLARCGFSGQAGMVVWLLSCLLNTGLGLMLLLRPGPGLHALQCMAIVGYGITAAIGMPELTLDHCGPLVKNLPVLAAALVLWLGTPAAAPAARVVRRQVLAD